MTGEIILLKKKYLFLIMLVCLFAIASVSAEDNSTGDIISVSNEDSSLETNLLEISENSISESTNDTDTLKVSDDEILTAGNDWYVNGSKNSSGDGKSEKTAFKTLQHALNNAVDGDTIKIASGIYTGTNNTGLTINNNLNFEKYGDGEAIFDAENQHRIFDVKSTTVNIHGLTFKNGKANVGGAIYFYNTVSDCSVSGVFINNTADYNYGGAIYFDNGSDCIVSGEFINNSGRAISFISASDCIVSGEFINNSGGAISFISASDCSISGEFINNSGGAISFVNASDCSISGEFINNAGHAISFTGSGSDCNISGVFINNTANGHGGAIYFYSASDCNISGVFINNTANDYGGAIYFDSVSDSSISGEFINNTAKGVDAIYFRNSVSNSSIINSVVLNAISQSENLSCLNTWFGNNASNYENKPYSNCESWLFLDGTSHESDVDGNYSVVFTLDNLYNSTSKSVTHPDIPDWKNTVFKLSAANGYLNKYTARPGESVVFTSTVNENGIVTASIGDISYSIKIAEWSFNITAPNVTKYYGGSERFVVTLEDNKGNPIANADVKITINGNPYTRTTDSNGVASMAINLNSGVYSATTEYNGTKVNSTVTVKDTVIADDFTKIFRNGTQYYGTFVDSQGNLIKNTDVKININGVYYTRKTDSDGVARMNINLNPGTYILTAANPLSGEMHTTNVTVLPSIVENYDLTKYYRNESKYTLRIIGDDGKPVGEGVIVKLNINGVFYERKTDASGYMNMNINLPPGTYTVTAEYNGLKASNTINVLSTLETRDLSMKYKDGSRFEAKILDGQGKPYAGQSVTFNINGVLYQRGTGDDGVARLAINLIAGEYIITSTYNGLNAANKVTISG